jgi:hypothetical protein
VDDVVEVTAGERRRGYVWFGEWVADGDGAEGAVAAGHVEGAEDLGLVDEQPNSEAPRPSPTAASRRFSTAAPPSIHQYGTCHASRSARPAMALSGSE